MHAVPVSRDPHAVFTAVCDVEPGFAEAVAESNSQDVYKRQPVYMTRGIAIKLHSDAIICFRISI